MVTIYINFRNLFNAKLTPIWSIYQAVIEGSLIVILKRRENRTLSARITWRGGAGHYCLLLGRETWYKTCEPHLVGGEGRGTEALVGGGGLTAARDAAPRRRARSPP